MSDFPVRPTGKCITSANPREQGVAPGFHEVLALVDDEFVELPVGGGVGGDQRGEVGGEAGGGSVKPFH